MDKQILILSEGEKISGPSTWKNGLIKFLRKEHILIDELDISKKKSILKTKDLSKYSTIHAYNITGYSLFFVLIAKLFHKKIVFTLHGNYFREVDSKKGLKRIFWTSFHNISVKLASKVTVPSSYLYATLLGKIPEVKSKLSVVPNGIEICKKCIKKHDTDLGVKINMLEITNFNIKEKCRGLVSLTKAVNMFNSKNKNKKIHLKVLGGGKLFKYFKKEYSNKYIEFLGKDPSVDKYIETADIFVHVTYIETFGYVILEAMSHNIPIISVKVGGIPEVTSPLSLSDPDENSLYKKIEQVLNNKNLRGRILNENKKNLKKFSWPEIIKIWKGIYQN